jgi:carbon storage regulator
MLILTRRVGESIRIGDGVRLTIRSKVRGHVTVALAAPAALTVTDDADVLVEPSEYGRRHRRYVISLLLGESLRIGEEFVVCINGCSKRGLTALARGRQVRVGVEAPRSVPVHREEIYQRIQRGEPVPCRRNH